LTHASRRSIQIRNNSTINSFIESGNLDSSVEKWIDKFNPPCKLLTFSCERLRSRDIIKNKKDLYIMLDCVKRLGRIFSLSEVCSYLKLRQRIVLGVSFLMDLMLSATKSLGPAAFAKAVDMLSKSETKFECLGVELTPMGLLYVSIVCYSTTLLPQGKRLMFVYLCDAMTSEITERLVEKTHGLPLNTVSQLRTTICQSHFFAINRAPQLVLETANGVIPNGLDTAVGIAIPWYLYGWKVGGGLLAYSLFSICFFNYLLARVSGAEKRGEKIDQALNKLTTQIYSVLNYIETVRLFGHSLSETRQSYKDLAKYLKRKRELILIETGIGLSENSMPFIGNIVLVGVMIGNFDSNQLGEFIFLFSYLPIFCGRLTQFSQSLNEAYIAIRGCERVRDVLEEDIESKIPMQNISPDFWGVVGVEFEHVSFSYKGEHKVLEDINFCVEPGQTAVLIGESGVGKTTIIRLLSRLHEATDGVIRINGCDIRQIPVKCLREHLGVMPQSIGVFLERTLRENVLYALSKGDEDDEELFELQETEQPFSKSRNPSGYRPLALKENVELQVIEAKNLSGKACKTRPIRDLPPLLYDDIIVRAGLQSVAERNHVRDFSGGEFQRVGIARLLCRMKAGNCSPMLILLDEPLKSLDPTTSAGVWAQIQKATLGSTRFIVSNHPLVQFSAHKLLFFRKGRLEKLEDQVPEDTLISKEGLFTR
jgi:ABC-type multidrug transport system fused ATPase/permease subunit